MIRVNARAARTLLSSLLDSADAGQTVEITRRGKVIARITPAKSKGPSPLPDLGEFHKTLNFSGTPMSQLVVQMRREARY